MSGEGPGRVGAREGRCEEARGQGGEGAREQFSKQIENPSFQNLAKLKIRTFKILKS